MDEEVELWRELYDFPLYEISSFGRVRNRHSGAILKPATNQRGFLVVGLRYDGKTNMRTISRLVAGEYLEEVDSESWGKEEPSVIHLDHDRTNCRASNLAWRPRWWAVRWEKEWLRGPTNHDKIMHAPTATIFETAWHAAHSVGMLEQAIYTQAENHSYYEEARSDWIFYRE